MQNGWKKCKNAKKIRAYTLQGRGSKDIYVDISAVYGSNEVSIYIVCKWIRKFKAGMESVKMHLSLQVVHGLLKKYCSGTPLSCG